MRIPVYVLPTTHWDREWVMTQGQFQVRLVDLVERLLQICRRHPGYRFYFDGQFLPLADYLEIRPERREELARCCAAGQIVTGPWYALSDQFLSGGETMLRNLLYGHALCRSLGGEPLPVGNVPDSFGSVAGLPMLLREFDIPYANFGRSRVPEKPDFPVNEFIWESRSGARVTTSNRGYYNGLFLSYPEVWTDIKHDRPEPAAIFAEFMQKAAAERSETVAKCLFFSIGIDHMEPREQLVEVIDYINQHQDQYELHFGTWVDYLADVEKELAGSTAVFRGEQCGTDARPENQSGTLSTLMPVKQLNFRCEKWLGALLEPLAALAARLGLREYPRGFLDKMWQLVIANQAHDSVCSCSIDQVNRDIIARYEYVENTARYLVKDTLEALRKALDTGSFAAAEAIATLTCFAPLSPAQSAPVRAIVSIPCRTPPEHLVLFTADGTPVPAVFRPIADKRKDLESVYMMPEQLAVLLSKDAPGDHPADQVFSIYEVEFLAPALPMGGWRTFGVKTSAPDPAVPDVSVHRIGELAAENDFLKLEIQPDGQVDVTDKRTGRCYRHLLFFEDRIEEGNSYEHRNSGKQPGISSRKFSGRAECVADLPFRKSFRTTCDFLPDVGLEIEWSLWADLPYIPIRIKVDNRRRNHCLHAVFTSHQPISAVESETGFEVVSRPVQPTERLWRHRPMQQWAALSDGATGFCVMTKGLYSQLGVSDEAGNTNLHVTLVRSSGEVGDQAGANYPTALTQDLGPHEFELAFLPFQGTSETAKCPEYAAAFCNPVAVVADVPHGGTLPAAGSLFRTAPDIPVVIAAMKQAEAGEDVVVRCWNYTGTTVNGTVAGVLVDTSASSTRVKANETTVLGPVAPDHWTVPPYSLDTQRFG